MKPECIEELVRGRREIEFFYLGHRYSITYYEDDRKNFISVCQYYHKPVDVKDADELLKLKIGRRTLEQIFSLLPDNAIDIR